MTLIWRDKIYPMAFVDRLHPKQTFVLQTLGLLYIIGSYVLYNYRSLPAMPITTHITVLAGLLGHYSFWAVFAFSGDRSMAVVYGLLHVITSTTVVGLFVYTIVVR